MPVERLWSWLRQELTYLHCHVDVQQLTDRIEVCGPGSTTTPRRCIPGFVQRPSWTRKRKNYGSRRRQGLVRLL